MLTYVISYCHPEVWNFFTFHADVWNFCPFHANVWNFFTLHADIWNFLLSMLTYGISLLSMLTWNFFTFHTDVWNFLLSMLTYGISLLSMLTYGISLLSMLTYGISTTFGRFDTNFTHYFRISSYNLFIFYGKGGVPLEYFSFLNWCQTAVSPQVFQFIFKCIFMYSTMLV